MRSLIIIREETGSLAGLSSLDVPFTLRKIGGEDSLAIQALNRNKEFCSSSAFAVILKDFENVRAVIPEEEGSQYVIVPMYNGSAPMIALSSRHFLDETLLIVPAWQTVEDMDEYRERVKEAEKLAEQGKIVVFNGIICARAHVILTEMKEIDINFCAVTHKVYESRRTGHSTTRFCGLFMEKFQGETTISDVLLCKSGRTVYLADLKGVKNMDSYEDIYKQNRKDKNGNVSLNIDDTYGVAEFAGAKENLVMSGDRDITLLGVEGLVVVDTGKKLLIAKRGADIEKLMKELDA